MDSDKTYYQNTYKNIYYEGIYGYFYSKPHKIMERSFNKNIHFDKVLELGALDGEHRRFVQHSYSKYYETDILIEESKSEENLMRLKCDANNLNIFNDDEFDRLLATCLIVHLTDIEEALTEWKRVVKKNGFITIWAHLEPSIFLRVVQYFFSRRKHNKNNIDWYEKIFSEHKTNYLRVNYYIEKVFKNSEIKKRYYPFSFLSWNFNLVAIYQIKV